MRINEDFLDQIEASETQPDIIVDDRRHLPYEFTFATHEIAKDQSVLFYMNALRKFYDIFTRGLEKFNMIRDLSTGFAVSFTKNGSEEFHEIYCGKVPIIVPSKYTSAEAFFAERVKTAMQMKVSMDLNIRNMESVRRLAMGLWTILRSSVRLAYGSSCDAYYFIYKNGDTHFRVDASNYTYYKNRVEEKKGIFKSAYLTFFPDATQKAATNAIKEFINHDDGNNDVRQLLNKLIDNVYLRKKLMDDASNIQVEDDDKLIISIKKPFVTREFQVEQFMKAGDRLKFEDVPSVEYEARGSRFFIMGDYYKTFPEFMDTMLPWVKDIKIVLRPVDIYQFADKILDLTEIFPGKNVSIRFNNQVLEWSNSVDFYKRPCLVPHRDFFVTIKTSVGKKTYYVKVKQSRW